MTTPTRHIVTATEAREILRDPTREHVPGQTTSLAYTVIALSEQIAALEKTAAWWKAKADRLQRGSEPYAGDRSVLPDPTTHEAYMLSEQIAALQAKATRVAAVEKETLYGTEWMRADDVSAALGGNS
jgi:hypothetical protein